MITDIATTALQRAIALRQAPPGCVDRSSQYCSADYRSSAHGFIIPRSRTGKSLGQCGEGELQNPESRTSLATGMGVEQAIK